MGLVSSFIFWSFLWDGNCRITKILNCVCSIRSKHFSCPSSSDHHPEGGQVWRETRPMSSGCEAWLEQSYEYIPNTLTFGSLWQGQVSKKLPLLCKNIKFIPRQFYFIFGQSQLYSSADFSINHQFAEGHMIMIKWSGHLFMFIWPSVFSCRQQQVSQQICHTWYYHARPTKT